MADVFLSYASEDRLRIKPLAEALEQRGFSVWWDRSLGAGEDYATVIARELGAAKAVIVVWTQASANSTFVRDEAGRARDQGRLVPVMLDRVEIPLGFGAFQAEDFSAWNGRVNAPQMQLLEEALRAKLEGRSIDGGVVAAKRRRLMARIRIVSVLGVVAAIAVIAFVGNSFLNPPQVVQQTDRGALLLELLNQGKLTPEQAIELARLLETDALGEATSTQEANAGASPPVAAAPAPGSDMADARGFDTGAGGVQVASVSSEEAERAARETFRASTARLLVSPDPGVRQAMAQLRSGETREAAMQTLLSYAESNPTESADIYRVVGAVGVTNDTPIAQTALENASSANPQDANVWRMLSYSYDRAARTRDARGAALVGAALEAQGQGETEVAEQRLTAALPNLQRVESRAFVEGQLGDVAASRNDWGAASRRYESALNLRERAPAQSPSAATLQVDAQKLVRALDRDGRTEEACRQAQQVEQEHNVAPADAELQQRCQRLRITVRPGVIAPVERERQVQPRVYEQQRVTQP